MTPHSRQQPKSMIGGGRGDTGKGGVVDSIHTTFRSHYTKVTMGRAPCRLEEVYDANQPMYAVRKKRTSWTINPPKVRPADQFEFLAEQNPPRRFYALNGTAHRATRKVRNEVARVLLVIELPTSPLMSIALGRKSQEETGMRSRVGSRQAGQTDRLSNKFSTAGQEQIYNQTFKLQDPISRPCPRGPTAAASGERISKKGFSSVRSSWGGWKAD